MNRMDHASRTHKERLAEPCPAFRAGGRGAKLKVGAALVFLDQGVGVPISDMMPTAVLKRVNFGELAAHRCRSTFRDWAAEAIPTTS